MNPRALITLFPYIAISLLLVLVQTPGWIEASPTTSNLVEISGGEISMATPIDQIQAQKLQVLSIAGFLPDQSSSDKIPTTPIDQGPVKLAVVDDTSSVASANLQQINTIPVLGDSSSLTASTAITSQSPRPNNVEKLKRGLSNFFNNKPFFLAASTVVAEGPPPSPIVVTSKLAGAETSAAIINGDPSAEAFIKGHNRLGRQTRPIGGPLRWGR